MEIHEKRVLREAIKRLYAWSEHEDSRADYTRGREKEEHRHRRDNYKTMADALNELLMFDGLNEAGRFFLGIDKEAPAVVK